MIWQSYYDSKNLNRSSSCKEYGSNGLDQAAWLSYDITIYFYIAHQNLNWRANTEIDHSLSTIITLMVFSQCVPYDMEELIWPQVWRTSLPLKLSGRHQAWIEWVNAHQRIVVLKNSSNGTRNNTRSFNNEVYLSTRNLTVNLSC